jgi:hypothetical protein
MGVYIGTATSRNVWSGMNPTTWALYAPEISSGNICKHFHAMLVLGVMMPAVGTTTRQRGRKGGWKIEEKKLNVRSGVENK